MRFVLSVLVAAAMLVAAFLVERASAETTTNRLTVYLDRGTMYSGYQTHWTAAACSWGYPLGTQLMLPDGFVVTCLDRGMLGGGMGWIDIWCPDWATARWVQQKYGDWTTVTVVRWGYGS